MYADPLMQLHNFFIQRVRDNSSKKRMPTWLKKSGLVVNPSNSGTNTNNKWADRYLYVPEYVQHDDEGRAYYLNPETNEFDAPTAPRFRARTHDEESDEVVDNGDELVEPDRFYQQKQSNTSAYYTQNLPSGPAFDAEPPRRANRSLKARTRKFFGGGKSGTPIMNRHSHIDHAMHVTEQDTARQREHDVGYHEYGEDDTLDEPTTSLASRSAPTDVMDDLDRELMGLATQERMPPVRTSRRTVEAWESAPYKAHTRPQKMRTPLDENARTSAPSRQDPPERDVMEFEHSF